ncbi:MAG: hypothetical protein QF745_08645, partial [Planctomycetota bacterium]|nr:hypothetical protein [Planctomycetota bacterium]
PRRPCRLATCAIPKAIDAPIASNSGEPTGRNVFIKMSRNLAFALFGGVVLRWRAYFLCYFVAEVLAHSG